MYKTVMFIGLIRGKGGQALKARERESVCVCVCVCVISVQCGKRDMNSQTGGMPKNGMTVCSKV